MRTYNEGRMWSYFTSSHVCINRQYKCKKGNMFSDWMDDCFILIINPLAN